MLDNASRSLSGFDTARPPVPQIEALFHQGRNNNCLINLFEILEFDFADQWKFHDFKNNDHPASHALFDGRTGTRLVEVPRTANCLQILRQQVIAKFLSWLGLDPRPDLFSS